MRELLSNIFYTASDRPFANDVETRAYLVTLETGNFLFYSSSHIAEEFDFIESAGGVTKQFLNHRHEASEYCDVVRQKFNAPLVCHALEEDAVSGKCKVSEMFSERHHVLPLLEAIPTPGHCPGSTCYLLEDRGSHVLFCGDTIYPENGEWKIYLHSSRSSGKDMIESLGLLGSLTVDVILPGLFIGSPAWEEVSPARWQSIIEVCSTQVE